MKVRITPGLSGTIFAAAAALVACSGGGGGGTGTVPSNSGSMVSPLSNDLVDSKDTGREALGITAAVATPTPFVFNLTVSAGAKNCLPNARGVGVISSVHSGQSERLHISVSGLVKNAAYDLFIIQVPTAPFGLSWYQGDVITNPEGVGIEDFVGRFSIETFIVAPGTAPAPVVFHSPFPDANTNPPTPPVHQYHVGLWFNSPSVAKSAGCPGTVTPFNGEHNAGIQVLNTATFPVLAGPLKNFRP